MVTASVDKIVLKKPISVDIDLKIVGAVIWVGRSSIEIQLEVTQSTLGNVTMFLNKQMNGHWTTNLIVLDRFISIRTSRITVNCVYVPLNSPSSLQLSHTSL